MIERYSFTIEVGIGKVCNCNRDVALAVYKHFTTEEANG